MRNRRMMGLRVELEKLRNTHLFMDNDLAWRKGELERAFRREFGSVPTKEVGKVIRGMRDVGTPLLHGTQLWACPVRVAVRHA